MACGIVEEGEDHGKPPTQAVVNNPNGISKLNYENIHRRHLLVVPA
jgi:hypothetical protein